MLTFQSKKLIKQLKKFAQNTDNILEIAPHYKQILLNGSFDTVYDYSWCADDLRGILKHLQTEGYLTFIDDNQFVLTYHTFNAPEINTKIIIKSVCLFLARSVITPIIVAFVTTLLVNHFLY